MNVVPKHNKQFNKILYSYLIFQSTNVAVLSLRVDVGTCMWLLIYVLGMESESIRPTNQPSVHPMCKQKEYNSDKLLIFLAIVQ